MLLLVDSFPSDNESSGSNNDSSSSWSSDESTFSNYDDDDGDDDYMPDVDDEKQTIQPLEDVALAMDVGNIAETREATRPKREHGAYYMTYFIIVTMNVNRFKQNLFVHFV